VPRGLKRFYGCGNLHFITCSCYRRLPLLNDPDRYRAFLDRLEALRMAHQFVVVGYVLMPEHFHLLIGEPNQGTPSTVMFALKQQTARAWLPRLRTKAIKQFWQTRFYDRNIFTENERVEKLR
jgi:putative transposase